MKKILIMFILTFMIICPNLVVHAVSETFYEGEYLDGAYIKKFKNGSSTGKYEQMRMFRRKSDNTPAYCIELWENIGSNQITSMSISDYNLLSEETWRKVELIAYYGYGYLNHIEERWYTATQFLIWKEIAKDSNIYFTDTLNGNKTDKFLSEMNEINTLISKHYILPSFNQSTYEIGLKEEIVITDQNNVLSKYRPVYFSLGEVSRQGNNLKIKGNFVGNTSIILRNGSNINQTQVYVSNTSQDLLVRGNYTPIDSIININVVAGKITLTKVDSEKDSIYPQGDAKLEGTTYSLYDNNQNLVEVITIDKNGQAISSNLPFGTYYLKETIPGIGYKLDNKTYKIELTKEKKEEKLKLKNEVIKGIVKITKNIEELNTNNLIPEENAVFTFYNKNNEKVGEIITNKTGEGELVLPYGKYLVKHEKGQENCPLIENFSVEITEEKIINLNLINKEIGYELEITKIDKDSFLPIRFSKAQFKIKDLESNKYLSYNDSEIFETNETGTLKLPFKLKIGKYYLEEVNAPLGYKKLNVPYHFEVNSSKDEPIKITVENEKKYGSLEITKQGEIVKMANNQLTHSKKELENIEFSLYAEEDIISGDGKIHYHKDELISKKTTDKYGKIIFEKLIFGKYYVLETKTLEEYNEDNQKYYVEINEDNLTSKLEKFNTLKKGNIKIKKLDSSNLSPIRNTEFEIYNEQKEKISEVTTDIEGNGYVFDLPLGKYYIVEKKVPFPYIKCSEKIEVELQTNNQVIDLTFKNDKQELEIEVPHTNVEINKSSFNNYWITLLILTSIISFIINIYPKHD